VLSRLAWVGLCNSHGSLLDFVDPCDPQSIIEWNKHRAVIGWEITPERIVVEAVCNQPEYEQTLRAFLQMIETEREESRLLSTNYRDDLAEMYRLELTEPVTAERIESNGSYIYSDMQFTIDYRRVMDLLMGQRLYQNPILALRELLQNAVDAVRHREALEWQASQPFVPFIAVRLRDNQLIVEDNGIGMDEHIFRNYFFQVRRSYYTSPEFRARQLDIDPVNEFGIGILSVFMIADQFVVESLARPDSPIQPTEPIYFEVPTAYSYFVKRPATRRQVGTSITLDLKPDHPFKTAELLPTIEELAPFIPDPVTVERDGQEEIYQPYTPGITGGCLMMQKSYGK
jgi:hypothetical protein